MVAPNGCPAGAERKDETAVAKPKVGLLLGTRGMVMQAQREGKAPSADVFLGLAERAEAAGLDSVWLGDSLVSKPRLEPVSAMAAVAARTSRVRIGTAVLLPAVRHPVPLAHSLATVDVLSNGRAIVGAGVGGAFNDDQRRDWTAAGVDPAGRVGRFTESVRIMKRLWTEDEVSFDGKHFTLDHVALEPRPIQVGGVPILLATHHRTGSEVQVRRAARYGDGVIGITDTPEQYAQMLARVGEAAAVAQRDASAFHRVYYLTVNIGPDRQAAEAEAHDFLMSYYKVPHWGSSWGPWGPPQEATARIAEFGDAGADTVIVRFASWDQLRQWERFEQDVWPAFA